jgi:hypothetical protein
MGNMGNITNILAGTQPGISERYPEPGNNDKNSSTLPQGAQRKDRVTLSPEAQDMATRDGKKPAENDVANDVANDAETESSLKTGNDGEEISVDQLRQIEKLRQRDREVRTHEQAHLASAGQYAAGGPSYTYESGPDGKKYAVGGEVPIDVSKESTPEETLIKMQVVAKAALAPLNPSSADRRIAARAAMISAEARRELQTEAMGKTAGAPLSAREVTENEDTASSTETIPSSGSTGASRARNMALKAYREQGI